MNERKNGVRYLSPKLEIGPPFYGRGKFRVLLLNANPYKAGIANLGWQAIVKHLLTTYPTVSIQIEYADTIRSQRIHWSNFNLIALHIPFETIYPAAIRMLHQLGLPVFSRQRHSFMPLVVAGGVYNPFPLVDFIDIFIFGDGRVPMTELVSLHLEGFDKKKILSIVAEKNNKGFYVPQLHTGEVPIIAMPELPLNDCPIHTIWSSEENVYNLPADYLSIMVALGCRYKCPFCVVSHCQGLRNDGRTEIDINQILEILNWRRQFIPVKTVKLFFASSINQEKLKEMLSVLVKEKVNVLVGSLNCKQIDEELVTLLRQSGPNWVIVAPETNENQRWKVNKGWITDELLFDIVKLCNKHMLPLAIYLIYGLPGETDKDIIELGKLVGEIRKTLDWRLRMQLHCNQVYLKPHTPFQYARQISPSENIRRFKLLTQQFIGRSKVEIKTENRYLAVLQSLIARGDRETSKLISSIALTPATNSRELIQRVQELIPHWQRYFNERKRSEIPWRKIIFQNHDVLWRRWSILKNKLS